MKMKSRKRSTEWGIWATFFIVACALNTVALSVQEMKDKAPTIHINQPPPTAPPQPVEKEIAKSALVVYKEEDEN